MGRGEPNYVTREALQSYYELRRLTRELGITDDVIPRRTISRKVPRHSLSWERLNDCMREEMDALRVGFAYVDFNACAEERERLRGKLAEVDNLRRRNTELAAEVDGYRTVLGLPPEGGPERQDYNDQ